MKYLLTLLLVCAMIAEYELRRRPKIKIRCRNGKCRIKIKFRSVEGESQEESDDLQADPHAGLSGRNVDHIDEGDLDKRETAFLKSGLQSLLQQVFEKREKAGDTEDTEYV